MNWSKCVRGDIFAIATVPAEIQTRRNRTSCSEMMGDALDEDSCGFVHPSQ